ncbi:hypothetical protein EYF80_018463 [Liparis tanakae]|uniref:Uncharacterized protein n=1 Tax=Liparis tanakae TaxID=230148 RepID=A0A4Z2I1K2_9TELE|nr:hypothetical protein EYF80_018463 [Liparis tanakae]
MRCCSAASLRATPSLLLCGRTDAGRDSTPRPLPHHVQTSFSQSAVRYASDHQIKTTTRAPLQMMATLKHFTFQMTSLFLVSTTIFSSSR